MKHSESIAKLAAALVAAQAELRAVYLDGRNPDYRSKYASLDNIIETVRPTLAKHGLAVVQGATSPHSDDAGRIAAIAVETMLVHASGEWICNTAIMPVVGRMLKGGGRAEPDPQAGGSALTYGRRYGIAALLCLATDEDDDGNAAKAQERSGGGRTSGASNGARQESPTTGIGRDKTPEHTTTATRSTPPRAVTRADVERELDAAPVPPGEVVKPFGKGKGTPIKDLDPADLVSAVEWAKANKPGPYADFIKAADAFLADVAA